MEFKLNRGEDKEEKTDYESVVIGGGPAGLTAGIYLGRSKISSIILEKELAGGYILTTEKIENYPGFPEEISGEKLGKLMAKHAKKFNVGIKNTEVLSIKEDSEGLKIKTTDSTYTSQTLIIATGTSNKKLNIPGEEEYLGKGISHCATCDAPFFEGEDIAVIGAGNSGVQEALYLSKFAGHIHLIEFLDHSTAEPILLDRIREKDNIELMVSKKALRFIGDEKLTGIEVEDRNTSSRKTLDITGAFIYAGLKPNIDFLNGMLEVNSEGFIKTDKKLRTSNERIYAAGDVRNTPLRQVATAVGDGAVAAYSVRKYLENR